MFSPLTAWPITVLSVSGSHTAAHSAASPAQGSSTARVCGRAASVYTPHTRQHSTSASAACVWISGSGSTSTASGPHSRASPCMANRHKRYSAANSTHQPSSVARCGASRSTIGLTHKMFFSV